MIEKGSRLLGRDVVTQVPVQQRHRTVEIDRRVDHQRVAKAETAGLLIVGGKKCRVDAAKAVAADTELTRFDISANQRPRLFHDPIQVKGVIGQVSGQRTGRRVDDEIEMRGRGNIDDMKTGTVQRFLQEDHFR